MASIVSRGSAATGYTLDTLLLFRSHRFERDSNGEEWGGRGKRDIPTQQRGREVTQTDRENTKISLSIQHLLFFFFLFFFINRIFLLPLFTLTRDGNGIAAYFDHRALCITTSFKYSMKNEIARTRFIIDLIFDNVENCIENFTSV